jgi:hypothetical protein
MCWLSWNLGASISWNPQGLPRPVMGLLYLYLIIFVYFQVNTLTVKLLTVSLFGSCYKNNTLKARNINDVRILYSLYDHLCQMFVRRFVFRCHWNRTSRRLSVCLSLVHVEAINDFELHALLYVIAPTVKRTSSEEFESRQTRLAVGSTHPLTQLVPRFYPGDKAAEA